MGDSQRGVRVGLFQFAVACLCCVLSRWSLASSSAGLHPADGPHVDIKIAVLPDAVRMQLTMNIVFLDEVMEFSRERDDRIDPLEGPALLEALQSWAEQDLIARIDGIPVLPIVDGLLINDPDDSLLPLFPRTGMRGIRKLRFEVAWPLKTPPQEIELTWPTYPPDIAIDIDDPPPLQIAAEVAVEGVREAAFFTVDSPSWLWRSGSTSLDERLAKIPAPEPRMPWKLPLVSCIVLVFGTLLGLAFLVPRRTSWSLAGLLVLFLGAGTSVVLGGVAIVEINPPGAPALNLPTKAQAGEVFVPLHGNIYRAFDYVNESDIYDALERSVEGELLEELYRTIYSSLVMEEAQGAVSRVIAVHPGEIVIEGIAPADGESPGITFDALYRWQVDGRVAHWGHVHERTNEYLARFGVLGTPSGWRIQSAQLLEQERIDQYDEPGALDPGEMPFDIEDEDFEL